MVMNSATEGPAVAPAMGSHEAIVESWWAQPAKFQTLSADLLGGPAPHAPYTDTSASVNAGSTGALPARWTQTDSGSDRAVRIGIVSTCGGSS